MGVRPIGGVMLNEVDRSRVTIALGGPSGSGKTTSAVSFGGGPYGKILFFNIEAGPEKGAGGANSLLYLKGIHDRVSTKDVMLVNVQSWAHMREQWNWLKKNAAALEAEGYTRMVWDGGTALCTMIEDDLRSLNPANLRGNKDAATGKEDSEKKNHKRELVTDLVGTGGRALEWDDYDLVSARMQHAIERAKELPFTLIVTFLDGDLYALENRDKKVGIGPDLLGRKLPARCISWFDFYFHCEKEAVQAPRKPGEPVRFTYRGKWLTHNDPTAMGNQCAYFAKTRAGLTLNQYEPADGVGVFKKLGIITEAAAAA